MDGCEALVLRGALDLRRDFLQPARGWTDEEWQEAADRLAGRGWLDAESRATDAGRAALDEAERITDALAAGPWRALGEVGTERLAALLAPLTRAVFTEVPYPNAIGVPAPA